MHVKTLANTDFETIMECFLVAFQNYYVKMPIEKEYYRERWANAKVDFRLSYGMFDRDKLVGFIIHAVDNRFGEKIAFNTGTGVLPHYRGRKIVKSIYDFALVDLKNNGISKCSLEVIKDNMIAIKSYKSIGFKVCRNYKCFAGDLQLTFNDMPEVVEVNKRKIKWDELPNQEYYSWDNQKETIIPSSLSYYEVLEKGILESYFILNKETGYIAQFDSLIHKKVSWNRLFSSIQSICKSIRINNVDETLKYKVSFLHKMNLKNTVDQYQMELSF